jgi:hypothetical protein
LHDQFQQTWREKLQNCSKTLSYRIFKETFIFKQYFDILGEQDFLALCKKSFEDTKGIIRISLYRRRTDNTMANKSIKGETTIYKTYI